MLYFQPFWVWLFDWKWSSLWGMVENEGRTSAFWISQKWMLGKFTEIGATRKGSMPQNLVRIFDSPDMRFRDGEAGEGATFRDGEAGRVHWISGKSRIDSFRSGGEIVDGQAVIRAKPASWWSAVWAISGYGFGSWRVFGFGEFWSLALDRKVTNLADDEPAWCRFFGEMFR